MNLTREQRLIEAALLDECSYVDKNYECFLRAVEWADENPKEGLVSLDKVCKYLDEELYTSFDYFGNVETTSKDSIDKKEFIENFRKAMEE